MRTLRLLAIISLVTFSFYVAVMNGLAAQARWNQDSLSLDTISKWEERVKPVLDLVPSDITVIGYVADWDIPGSQYGVIDQENEYTFTQYALTPLRVVPGLESEWIIGNFTNEGFRTWLDKNLPSYEITPIGRGIYLIHRISP